MAQKGVIEIGGKVFPCSIGKTREQNGVRQVKVLPFAGPKLINEVRGVVLDGFVMHEVNDAYAVTGINPQTLASYQGCGKIRGAWKDGVLYVDIWSIERFFRRIGKTPSFFRLRLTFIRLLIILQLIVL